MDERANGMRITVGVDGPYRVSGSVPLVRAEIVVNDEGESVEWRETGRVDVPARYALCRCGESHAKPFCDGTHAEIGFDGTEVASREAYLDVSVCFGGPNVKLRDARKLCAEARFCDRAGGLWNLVERVEDDATRELVEQEAAMCPSGRYTVCDPDGVTTHEPDLEASIALVEDPSLGVSGPLWVRGGIPVVSEDGTPYEVRNRVTLCRCGRSANKPFCDGTHISAGFHDESASD